MDEANRTRVKAKIDPQLGPVEALGVALSIPMSNTEMMKCQELAKPMLAHLARLGWFLVSDAKDEFIKAEMERLRKENLELGLRVAMKEVDDNGEELAKVRAEIYLRSEVLRAFPDDLHPDSKGSKELSRQWERFLWLLSRERELLAKSEPEGGDRG